jgi:hypothetical protein
MKPNYLKNKINHLTDFQILHIETTIYAIV